LAFKPPLIRNLHASLLNVVDGDCNHDRCAPSYLKSGEETQLHLFRVLHPISCAPGQPDLPCSYTPSAAFTSLNTSTKRHAFPSTLSQPHHTQQTKPSTLPIHRPTGRNSSTTTRLLCTFVEVSTSNHSLLAQPRARATPPSYRTGPAPRTSTSITYERSLTVALWRCGIALGPQSPLDAPSILSQRWSLYKISSGGSRPHRPVWRSSTTYRAA
jgi:hypothetical protein